MRVKVPRDLARARLHAATLAGSHSQQDLVAWADDPIVSLDAPAVDEVERGV